MFTKLIKGSLIIAIFAINGTVVSGLCPDAQLIKPCVCGQDEEIVCIGNKQINYKEIFQKLSKKLKDNKKDLEAIYVSNGAIEELPANMFGDVYFKKITFEHCVNLKKIHLDAFTGTDQLTEEFHILHSPKLGQNAHIFDILNKFKHLQAVSIARIGLQSIPTNAFKSLNTLVWLYLNGTKLEKIGEKAFFNLNKLTELHVVDTNIPKLTKNVFVFSKKSDTPLEICLYKNKVLHTFDVQTFTHTDRPTTIDFSGEKFSADVSHDSLPKQMPVLEQKVFMPFLQANRENKIAMKGQHFDCQDCRNHWLKKNTNLLGRVVSIRCASGRMVTDAATFAKCK